MQYAIFNDAAPPTELQRYIYRQNFGMTEAELNDEPSDVFFTNLRIYSLLKEREAREMNNG